MKITIDIPDEEIKNKVFELVTNQLAHEIFVRQFDPYERQYKRISKECIKEVMQEHTEEIIDRAIPLTADYIGKKGVAKFVKLMGEGN